MSRHYPRHAKEESDAELHRNMGQSPGETLLMPLHLRRKESVDHIDDWVNCYWARKAMTVPIQKYHDQWAYCDTNAVTRMPAKKPQGAMAP